MTITLSELYQVHRVKDNSKKASYKRVLELMCRRIRNVNGYGGMNTFFEIPGMIVGFPLYNIYECMEYIVDEMRKRGFLIQILPPPHVCVLYISWDPKEITPTKAMPKTSKRLLEHGAAPKLNNGKYF